MFWTRHSHHSLAALARCTMQVTLPPMSAVRRPSRKSLLKIFRRTSSVLLLAGRLFSTVIRRRALAAQPLPPLPQQKPLHSNPSTSKNTLSGQDRSFSRPGSSVPAELCQFSGRTHGPHRTQRRITPMGVNPALYARHTHIPARPAEPSHRLDAYRTASAEPSRRAPAPFRPRDFMERDLLFPCEHGAPVAFRPYNMDAMAFMERSPLMFLSTDYERRMQGRGDDVILRMILERSIQDQGLKRPSAVHQSQQPSELDKAKARIPVGPVFDCPICLDSQPEADVAIIQPCGHRFCRDCLKGHVSTSIEDAKFPISCPVCTGETEAPSGVVSQQLAEDLGMTESQAKRWSDLELAAFSVVLECGRCRRSARVDKNEYTETQILFCPFNNCSHRWCKACNGAVPFGTTHNCDGQAELQALMRQRGWKPCPGCKTNTEKQTGCNHMTCTAPGCQTHWCYVCGDAIAHASRGRDLAIALDTHYKQGCRMSASVTGA